MADTLKIGDVSVGRIGLGTNRIQDTQQSRDILRYAVDQGISFIDTAHLYTGGTSERVIGETFAPYPDGLVVASKAGMAPGGNDGTPENLRRELEQSLGSLRTERIALYQLHRVDPRVDIEISIGAFKEFQDEGKIGSIGLSEVTVEQIKRARAVAHIVSVQNHYNLDERKYDDVVDYCTAEGIIFIPFFPLGGRSTGLSGKTEALARKYHVTPHQLALAWLLKRSPMMLPIPGTLTPAHLLENLQAVDIALSDEDYASL